MFTTPTFLGAWRLGAGAFGRRRLCKRNPWRRTVIKCICYSRNTLFSSIQLLFKQHHFHPEKIYLLRFVFIDPASISVNEGLFSSKQHTLRNNSLHHSQW